MSSAAIPYGSSGVVVTCDQGKERNASRDLVRNLNEAYERVFPDERRPERPADASGTNVADALAAELKDLKETDANDDAKRFKPLNLDFKACMFVTMRADAAKKAPPSPTRPRDDSSRSRIATKAPGGARHGIRLIPCDTVCFAGIDEIKKALAPLIAEHFPVPSETDADAGVRRRTENLAGPSRYPRANRAMGKRTAHPRARSWSLPPQGGSHAGGPHHHGGGDERDVLPRGGEGLLRVAQVQREVVGALEEERDAEKARTAMPPKPPPEEKTSTGKTRRRNRKTRRRNRKTRRRNSETGEETGRRGEEGDEAK